MCSRGSGLAARLAGLGHAAVALVDRLAVSVSGLDGFVCVYLRSDLVAPAVAAAGISSGLSSAIFDSGIACLVFANPARTGGAGVAIHADRLPRHPLSGFLLRNSLVCHCERARHGGATAAIHEWVDVVDM